MVFAVSCCARDFFRASSLSREHFYIAYLDIELPVVELYAVPPRRADELHHHAPPPVQLGLGLEAAQFHASADGN